MKAHETDGWFHYECERTVRRLRPGRFEGKYRPAGPVYHSSEGDLDHWLKERYCLYAVDRRDRIHPCGVHHPQWPLQPAEADILEKSIVAAHGLTLLDTPPLLHIARSLDTVAWRPKMAG